MATYPDALPVSASPEDDPAGVGDASTKIAGDTPRDRAKSLYVDELKNIIGHLVGMGATFGLPNAVGMPANLATAISSGKVFALQQISTNGVQIAESTTLVEILAIDLYVVTSAQTAPSWRLIFGDYGLHLVPSDYGGAGVVTINGVADIVTFAEAGIYLLVGDGANAWTLTPATDYDAINGAIAAVQDDADAAQTRADDAYDLAQDAFNGLNGKQDALATTSIDVSLNSHKLTNVADPSSAQDAATKAYVDALANGLDWKASVRFATTTNDSLSGLAARDGVTPIAGDRCLVKDHATGSSKGIYVAASGAWSRATDADSSAEVTSGMAVFVAEGTVNGGKTFVLTTADPITLGSTSLTFSQSASAPGLSSATPQPIGTASAGTSNAGAAREDHVHALPSSGTADFGSAAITTTGNVNGSLLKSGSGSPESSVTATVGALYRDTSSGRVYMKMSGTGNTGWVGMTPDGVDPAQIQIIASGTTATIGDHVRWVFIATGSGNFTLTGAAIVIGKEVEIQKTSTDANTITYARAGSENVQGAAANYPLPLSSAANYPAYSVKDIDATNRWVS